MNRICKLEGVTLNPNKQWTDLQGVDHPARIWPKYTDEQLEALGVEITYAPPETSYNRKYEWSTGRYKSLESLQERSLLKVDQHCAQLLSSVSGLFEREEREGKRVPLYILAFDQRVREYKNTLEAAIKACVDVPELIDVDKGLTTWPELTDDVSGYVPYQVTRLQARVALQQAGLLELIEQSLVDPVAIEYWNNAQVFKRNSPFITELSPILNPDGSKTEEQVDAEIDQLFITAIGVE